MPEVMKRSTSRVRADHMIALAKELSSVAAESRVDGDDEAFATACQALRSAVMPGAPRVGVDNTVRSLYSSFANSMANLLENMSK